MAKRLGRDSSWATIRAALPPFAGPRGGGLWVPTAGFSADAGRFTLA